MISASRCCECSGNNRRCWPEYEGYDEDVKMNRLHLHVTDSQLWPLEIPSMPELAEKGAYAPGLTYSPEDLQQILDYAEARGIQVIVEIDMPGHSTCCRKTWGMKKRVRAEGVVIVFAFNFIADNCIPNDCVTFRAYRDTIFIVES